MRKLLAIPLLLATAFACTVIPTPRPVGLTFSVKLQNKFGPVAGLRLWITRLKEDEIEAGAKLPLEQFKQIDPQSFAEVIANGTTDDSGVVQFTLSKEGDYYLGADQPAGQLDAITLQARSANKPTTLTLEWPLDRILTTAQLRGKIAKGLFSAVSFPLPNASLTLHRLVGFQQIAATTTDANGEFRIDGVPDGLYFLHLRAAGIKDELRDDSFEPRGDIVIEVDSKASTSSLSIAVDETSCGLKYDLEANKTRYQHASKETSPTSVGN